MKIDRSFLREKGDETDHAIVRAIIAIAQALGIRVIAEGIETPAQIQWLRRLGCREGQGYVFSQPMNAGDTTGFLAAGTHGLPLAPMSISSSSSGDYLQ